MSTKKHLCKKINNNCKLGKQERKRKTKDIFNKTSKFEQKAKMLLKIRKII